MKIYPKILLTVLPLVILSGVGAYLLTAVFSRQALTVQTRILLEAELDEAMDFVSDYNLLLVQYGLGDLPANVQQAQFDATSELRNLTIGGAGFILAVDKQGLIVSHPDAEWIGSDVSQESWFQDLRIDQESVQKIDLQGISYLAAYQYFEDWGWYILAAQPEAEIFQPVNQALSPGILLIALISVIVSLALAWVIKRTLRPLEMVSESATQFGRGSYEIDLPVISKDEIGNLASVFNQTAQRIKENMAAIRESEEKYRAFFENSMDAIMLTSPDGSVLAANPAACKMLGRTEAEICALGRRGLVDTDDPRLQIHLEERSRTGKTSGELTMFRHDGSPFPVELSSVVFQDKLGNTCTSMIIRDIAERKRAEAALLKSEEKFKQVFESANVGKSITLPTGEIFVNKAFAQMLGYSRKELSNKTWQELTPPGDIDGIKSILTPLQSGQKDTARFSKRYLHRDGSVIWGDVSTVMQRDRDGTPLYFITTVVDITELKRTTEAYESIVENTLQGLVIYQDGRISFANQAMARIFGMTLEELQALSPEQLLARVHPDDLPEIREKTQRRLAGEEVSPISEYRYLQKDGSEIWLQTLVAPIKYLGRPAFQNAFIDVTERKRAERQLLQMERLYATLSQVNQTIVRVKNRDELFHSICNIAVKFGNFTLAWIGLLDEDSGDIKPFAAEGLEIAHWTLPVINIYEGGFKNGVIATALRTSRVMTNEDIKTDKKLETLYDQIQKYKNHSSAAVPICLRGKGIGVLSLVSSKTGLFQADEEIRLLEEMGTDISFALETMESDKERRLAELALRESEAALQKAQHVAHVGSWVWNIQENRLEWSDEMYHIFGIDKETFSGSLPDVIARAIHPDDRAAVEQSNLLVIQEKTPMPLEYRVVRQDGAIRNLWAEAGELLLDDKGQPLKLTGIVQDITERKRAEQEIESLAKFPQENTATVLRIGRDGTLLYGNRASRRLLDQWGCKVGDRLPEEIQLISYQTLAIPMSQEVEVTYEDATEALMFVPIVDKDYVNVYGRDVTEHRQAQTALENRERYFRALIENNTDAIAVISEEGRILYQSPASSRILGASIEEFARQEVFDFVHPDDRAHSLELFTQLVMHPEELVAGQIRYRHKDGAWHWIEAVGKNLLAEPSVQGIVVNFRDVTERKQAADLLREQKALLDKSQSISHVGSWELDLVSNRLTWSDEAYRIFGFQPGQFEATYEAFLDGVHPDDHASVNDAYSSSLSEGRDRYEIVHRLVRRDNGEIRTVHEKCEHIRDSSGNVVRSIGMVQDVTEQKQTEQLLRELNTELEQHVEERTQELNNLNLELQHANRAKDEFLANMSHELRTPLNSILGLSESLLEQRRDPLSERQQRSLAIIEASGHHLLGLINDVLDVAKIEAGKSDYQPETIKVAEVCQSSLSFIRTQAVKKSVTVNFQEDTAVSMIQADPRRLKQILVNLLTNAVKFTPEHGQVTLQVQGNTKQNSVQFSVSDTGIGISAEDLKRLFQPFVQVDSKLNRHHEGTGLGLVLVQKLTDLHGGSVQVESEVGVGSRFTVSLPWDGFAPEGSKYAGAEDVPLKEKLSSDYLERPLEQRTILLAEDNLANILTIGEYLQSHEYEIVVAHDGLEAIDLAEKTDPDVILMDIQMPAMDGLEATRCLRSNPRFTSTPIVALTALAMPGDRERCLEAGATEYMSKPVSLKALLKTVESFFE